MYIEFRLPTGGGIQYTNLSILQMLSEWAKQYGVAYTRKNIKYTLRVTFDDENMYSLFALTWTGPEYRLIETLKSNKY